MVPRDEGYKTVDAGDRFVILPDFRREGVWPKAQPRSRGSSRHRLHAREAQMAALLSLTTPPVLCQ